MAEAGSAAAAAPLQRDLRRRRRRAFHGVFCLVAIGSLELGWFWGGFLKGFCCGGMTLMPLVLGFSYI